jgi:hypothetical protein
MSIIFQNLTNNTKKTKQEGFSFFNSQEGFNFTGFDENACKTGTNNDPITTADYNACLEKAKKNAQIIINNKGAFDTSNLALNTKYTELSTKIANYQSKNVNVATYDTIDDNGHLLYEKNVNFKETIPKLKDAVLEDTNDLVNYQNNIYVFSGIIAVSLIIAAIIVIK